MKHADAVKNQLVERYFLGELEAEQMEAFEEHYFSCAACADDVRLTASFQENARAVLRERPEPITLREEPRARSRFWMWIPLQPAWGLCALLLIMVGWQSMFRIPGLERDLAQANSPQVLQTTVLRAETRGGGSTITLPSDASNVLFVFDVNASLGGGGCVAEVVSEGGQQVLSHEIACPAAGTSVHLLTPAAQMQAGSYLLTITSQANMKESLGPFRFTIQRTEDR